MRPRRLLLLLVVLTAATGPSTLHARSLSIESFEAGIVVHADGSIQVTETIRPRFVGSWNGIFRTIPVEYRTPQGTNYTLFLEGISVTDDAGTPLRHELSRERHYRKIKIWVPDAGDTVRIIVLRYQVENGLRFFEEHDELYWNVTGDEWQAPILTASARIELPPGVTGLRAVAFTGVYGSREQAASLELGGHEVAVRTSRRLDFREGLTVAVGWDPGRVRRPGLAAQAGRFLRSNWMVFIPLAVFGLMGWLWYTRGRDPRRRPIAPQYEPPEGLTPAELGTLLDNSPDIRDITATLVDLAVRGYLLIQVHEVKKLLGLRTSREYRFSLRRPVSAWSELQAHERSLMGSLFTEGARDSVESSELEHTFYAYLPGIRDRIFNRLVERGFYLQRPDKVKHRYVAAGVLVGILVGVGGALLCIQLGQSPLPSIVSGVLSAGIAIGFGLIMPARTLRGARAIEAVLGFEEFLSRVEGERLQRVVKTPEMFEKYLPYAMALGVERKWAKAFEDIYRQPPDWYQGGEPHTFHPHSFVSDLGQMSERTAAAMSSAPRSSGGSGFGSGSSSRSGGGSSGGGFGGGGGGGF
ncbi:MAG TPA: DUF2207 domain-containing protein [Candidatus Methylomirabilis sp.]|nr:DUF2207 domain-containing protein [Candidatus Methylomirabilis sp.]